MAPLPPDSTKRLYLDYTDSQNEHTLMVRVSQSSDAAAAMVVLHDFLTALDPDLFTFTILGARFSDVGDNISLPISWTGDAAYGADTMNLNRRPLEIRFLGRSTGGRRVSYSIYGSKYTLPDNFRFPNDFDADLSAAMLVLQEAWDSQVLVAIDGLEVIPYDYVSVNYNSYWEQASR